MTAPTPSPEEFAEDVCDLLHDGWTDSRWAALTVKIRALDAALPEMLAFVGRVAVAIGATSFAVDMRRHTFAEVGPIAVTFKVEDGWCYSDELCHAALLAALAALETR